MAKGICTICGSVGPLVVCRATKKNSVGKPSYQRDGACPRCARMMAQTVPEFITIARQERELTQKALAKLIGVSEMTITNMENGHTNHSPALLIKIANAFSMSLDALVGRISPS